MEPSQPHIEHTFTQSVDKNEPSQVNIMVTPKSDAGGYQFVEMKILIKDREIQKSPCQITIVKSDEHKNLDLERALKEE